MAKCVCGAPEQVKCVDCQDAVCDACVSADGRCEECEEQAGKHVKKEKKSFTKMKNEILDD